MSAREMLCQDCLRVRPYTIAGHAGRERCICGGEFCGCGDCRETIKKLHAGFRTASELGLQRDIASWNSDTGFSQA